MIQFDSTVLFAVEPVTSLSPESILMLIFGCLVLYGGFFWCTKIAWDNRNKHIDDGED